MGGIGDGMGWDGVGWDGVDGLMGWDGMGWTDGLMGLMYGWGGQMDGELDGWRDGWDGMR